MNKIVKVQFGCGTNQLQGWYNHDLRLDGVDITKPLPYNDNTVSFIFCEHLVEHLTMKEAFFYFDECLRILKPHGAVRFAVPAVDLIQKLDGSFEATMNLMIRSGIRDRREMLTIIMSMLGHKTAYTSELLRIAMFARGFVKIRSCEYGQSNYLEMQDCDSHTKNHHVDNIYPGASKILEAQMAICEAEKPLNFEKPRNSDQLYAGEEDPIL